MGKKQVAVSLRKPPSAESISEISESTGIPSARPRSHVDELRASFGNLRAITLHLPSDLASRLLLRCMQDDRDVSNVVADLVRKHLEGKVEDPELTLAMIVRWMRSKIAQMSALRSRAAAA
jgi:hypothetical protein